MWHEERNGIKYGVPIGNQTSQCFAVQYLNDVDHYIKDQLGQKYFGRYMDDSVLIGKNKSDLNEIKELVRKKYAEHDLEMNAKSQVIPLHKGITYLGKRFELAPNGKIIERLTSQNIRHRYTEIHKKAALVALGEMTTEEYWTSFIAWNMGVIPCDIQPQLCGASHSIHTAAHIVIYFCMQRFFSDRVN